MADQVLKDSHGRTIGKIKESGTTQTIHDAHGHRLGTYDSKTNKTKDAHGHIIGTGNLLTSLLR
jgi:hypothetical protein